jgi:hypothetical protein
MHTAAKINSSRFISSLFSCCYLPREPVEREPLVEFVLFVVVLLSLLLLVVELFERDVFTDEELVLFCVPTFEREPCPCVLGRCCDCCNLLLPRPVLLGGVATLLRDVLLLRELRIVLGELCPLYLLPLPCGLACGLT